MSPIDDAVPLLVIVGPTASGKTELALVLAETLGGEILSADSVQIYRYFDIGSGKPTAAELARAPHHLIDSLDPLDEIDAAGWAIRAEARLQDIVARGRRPIVCGGSFLWVRALLFGLAPAPAADATLRAEHRRIAETKGRAALHQQLAAIDPVIAAKLAPNDLIRVSRAIEVFELTGIRMSQWQAEHGFRTAKRPYRLIGVTRDRDALANRIHTRAEQMLRSGWVDEVRGLCDRGYERARAMSSVGYRELHDAVTHGTIDETTLLDAVSRKTRVFARRQRTWLRDEPVQWLSPELMSEPEELVRAIDAFTPEIPATTM